VDVLTVFDFMWDAVVEDALAFDFLDVVAPAWTKVDDTNDAPTPAFVGTLPVTVDKPVAPAAPSVPITTTVENPRTDAPIPKPADGVDP